MVSNGIQPLPKDCDCEPREAVCIPEYHALQCYCGNLDCAFLDDTQGEVNRLEQSLRTAGRLGQALLVRHEAYVADTEVERRRMGEEIERLDSDKRELERKNASVIGENRRLLEQLDTANAAISESDLQVEALTATLHSTQQELKRLDNLASRTELLERQLENFEQDQARLLAQFATKSEEEKAATLRWQKAERALVALEHQIGSIEREAREEMERHVEAVGRLERRTVVETEVADQGHPNGIAAASLDKAGSTVVSHFVKDILQDNANLQSGIVELRDMLASTNEEVERLKYELFLHGPAEEKQEELVSLARKSSVSLEMKRASMQEVHVHHHYHGPPPTADTGRRSSQTVRRPKKKRFSGVSGQLNPHSGFTTPRTSISGPIAPSGTAAVLAPANSAIPPRKPPDHRWSMRSSQHMSSAPSSPQSSYIQSPSLFDRSYSDISVDSSRPSTPGNEDIGSPIFMLPTVKILSEDAFRQSSGTFRGNTDPPMAHSKPVRFAGDIPPLVSCDVAHVEAGVPKPHGVHAGHEAIPEENEHDIDGTSSPPATADQGSGRVQAFTDDDLLPTSSHGRDHDYFSRPLRRAASHESLLSVSGMDIHTLRPCQMLAGHGGRSFSAHAVVSATTAVAAVDAKPSLPGRTSDRSRSLLSGMAADHRHPAGVPVSKESATRRFAWFGRWATAPAPAPAPTPAPAPAGMALEEVKGRTGTVRQSISAAPPGRGVPPKLRAPGINQSGPILGLGPLPTPSRVPVLRNFDEEALRQSLTEA